MSALVNAFSQIGYPNLSSGRYNTVMKMDRLRDYIEEELNRRAWTMRELARRAGLSHGTISNTLAGKSKPTTDTLEGIAHALGEPPEKLFRMAGLLRPARDDDEVTMQDAIAVMRELSPGGRRRVLEFLYFQLQQERRRERGDTSSVHAEG